MQSLELALGVGESIGHACSLPFERSLLRGLKACAGVVALVEREWLGGGAYEGAGGSRPGEAVGFGSPSGVSRSSVSRSAR